MSQEFLYDEKGSTFLYFLVSFFGMVLIPLTYFVWPQGIKDDEKRLLQLRHVHGKSNWYKKRHEELQREKSKPKLRKWLLIIAWIGFFVLAYKASQVERDHVEYDPYVVLRIDKEADPKTIKKAFRQLLLEKHPDKGGDPHEFMQIRKAYEALTDDETKKNWDEFGNPDGPQAMVFGIALPSWIVAEENRIVVLGIYIFAFMVILPVVVGLWWTKSIKYSKEKVLLNTTQLYYYFFNKTPNMNIKRMLKVLSASFEFDREHNPKVRAAMPSDNKDIPELIRQVGVEMVDTKKEPLFNRACSVKARTLIYANLNNLEINQNLTVDMEYILQKCVLLIQEMISCLAQLTVYANYGKAAMPRLDTVENAMKLAPMLVQGQLETKSPLLQLPYFNEDFVKYCSKPKCNVRNLRSLAKLADSTRRQALRNMGSEEYDTMITCLKRFPLIDVGLDIKVLDEEESHVITAGSIVTVTVNLSRRCLGDIQDEDPVTSVNKVDEENEETTPQQKQPKLKPWEKQVKKKKGAKKKKAGQPKKKPAVVVEELAAVEDVDENAGSESDDSDIDNDRSEEEEWEALQKINKKKQEMIENSSDKMTHTVYAPNFPQEKQEWWWVYICDRKRHMLITSPVLICNLKDFREVECKFPAPNKPGKYSFTVCVRSDAYLDCDQKSELKFDVGEAKVMDENHPQWQLDETEDEEDDALVEESEDEGISTDEGSD